MIQIANPLYDVVFKYLMEDMEAARLLISRIIEEPIEELRFLPQEHATEVSQKSLTVYRLDFSATIRVEENRFKQVLVELQKAKLATDIMRFRRYLGEQYRKKENVVTGPDGEKKALPLVSIYFLGYALEHVNVPVIQVKRDYLDARTRERITRREDFIESLTHDSYVIQVALLREPYRSELERLLSVFDQSRPLSNNHILEIDETQYPEAFSVVLRRLIRAAAEPGVRDTMDVEDDILEELAGLERKIAKQDEALKAQNRVLEEKDRVLEEKDRIIKELEARLQHGGTGRA